MTREERPRLRQRVVARLWGERPALGDVDAERGFTLAECVRDVRRAHVHTGELKTAELIDRAAEVEREPSAGPKASVAEQQSIAFEVAAEVGERGPRDLIGDSPPGVEAAHVGERRQVDVGEEISAERCGIHGGRGQLEWLEAAHVRDKRRVRAHEGSPGRGVRVGRWPRGDDLVLVLFVDGETFEDRREVRPVG